MREGWQPRKLGELCQLISGQHIDSKDYNTESRGIGYLTGPSDFGPRSPVISKWTEHPKIKAQMGDILITVKGSGVGKVNLLDQAEVAISRQLMAVRVTGADARFVHTFLISTFNHFQSLSTGAAIPGISRNQVLGLEIPTPSIPEQQRIIAILDEAFAGIATAKAHTENNLQNARKLFDGLTQSLFPHDSCSPAEHTLDELSELIVDCEHKTAPTQEHGIPSIRTPNIGKGRLLLDGVYRVSEETYREWTRRVEPQPGDLILAREAPAGNVAVIPDGLKVCLGQRTVLIRPKKDAFDPSYLAHLLLQKNSQRRLLAHSRGATVQHINVKDIRAFKVAEIPPLTAQKVTVTQINALIDQEAALVAIYSKKLAALDELKQSLLAKAFAGELA